MKTQQKLNTQLPENVCISASIFGNHVIELILINENLTTERYLKILHEVNPALALQFPDELNPTIPNN